MNATIGEPVDATVGMGKFVRPLYQRTCRVECPRRTAPSLDRRFGKEKLAGNSEDPLEEKWKPNHRVSPPGAQSIGPGR
jgi:hypothetical protein